MSTIIVHACLWLLKLNIYIKLLDPLVSGEFTFIPSAGVSNELLDSAEIGSLFQ
jgi:hypothetical protein